MSSHYSGWYAKRLAELNTVDRDSLFRCEWLPIESTDKDLPTMAAPQANNDTTNHSCSTPGHETHAAVASGLCAECLERVVAFARKVVSGRRLLNIGERQATLEAWYEHNPNVTNEYRETEAAIDTLAALLADLDAGDKIESHE